MAVLIIASAYIAAQMMADIMSLKIALFAGYSMDAGTIIYPVTFTLRDLAHKTVGKRGAQTLVIAAAVINLAMAGLFWVAKQLPYDPGAGPQPDWNAVLGPVWRIVIASIIAEVLSELVDTETYHFWVTRVTRRFQWLRVLVSNSVSVPLDSLTFCWLAFGGKYDSHTVWVIVAANIVVKMAVTLLSLPMIYLAREKAPEQA